MRYMSRLVVLPAVQYKGYVTDCKEALLNLKLTSLFLPYFDQLQ